MKQDNLPNLSILLSRGEENNDDSPSTGEGNGKSPGVEPRIRMREARVVAWRLPVSTGGPSGKCVLERSTGEGESPVPAVGGVAVRTTGGWESRVARDCSSKRVVNLIRGRIRVGDR